MKISLTFLGAAVVAHSCSRRPALAEYPERRRDAARPVHGRRRRGTRAYEFEECLGQDVIVNKPGAGGELGFAEAFPTATRSAI